MKIKIRNKQSDTLNESNRIIELDSNTNRKGLFWGCEQWYNETGHVKKSCKKVM